MILIGDCGSTTTKWRLILSDNSIIQAETAGFSPFFQTEKDLENELRVRLLPQLGSNAEVIAEVYFYGTGISTQENEKITRNGIQKVFSKAKIFIQHDLLGAARALCGHQSGIACILGTGSNSCLYDGKNIVQNIPSLGYLFGDEGSGASLGKQLLTEYLQGTLPERLTNKFNKRYATNRDEILENVYKKPMPQTYLATFSKFIFHNINDPHIYRMVYLGFSNFFEKNIMKYEDYKAYAVHFVGSIAFYYANILRQVANDKGIIVRNILEDPIAGLALYHAPHTENQPG